ncbi:hypothetical protein [Thiohalobacter thiocyanaticus]|nr:hypothetical protein [Thiohalobacter thiocyanaticus]
MITNLATKRLEDEGRRVQAKVEQIYAEAECLKEFIDRHADTETDATLSVVRAGVQDLLEYARTLLNEYQEMRDNVMNLNHRDD